MLWLPPSETFIRNQMNSMRQWEPRAIGMDRLSSVLARNSDTVLFRDDLAGGIRRRLFSSLGRDRRLDRWLRETRVDLIHAHFGPDATFIAPTAQRLGIPLIVTMHGYDVTSRLGERYEGKLRRVFDYASRIIAVSGFIADRAIAMGAPPEKVVVHHIGIPVEVSTLSPPPATWDVLFVGRLVEKKGVQDLVEALDQLPSDQRSARVGVIGEGILREQLAASTRSLGLNVEFLGAQPPESVATHLAASRMLVVPSRRASTGDMEGLPTVLLEAARAGVPVVSYRHGGVEEAVAHGQTGLVSTEGDVEGLSSGISWMLSHPEEARVMGAEGRRRLLRDFDIVKQTAALEAIYSSI